MYFIIQFLRFFVFGKLKNLKNYENCRVAQKRSNRCRTPFILHVRISATRAFFVALVLGIILVLSIFIFENLHIIRFFVIISFFAPLGTFLINLEIFERREKKGMQDAT
ncbi:hypothetical protein [Bacillus sp. 166amftsu]|uniref:hypothetical protein n=1 Tax=Bacillus sp. 166amftsu TaxID=1761753 RepID=UPI0008966FE0|nr:hypothetical protein [Bacillus sp. 166amftsu]SDZ27109.1 hypothetical protein SAMN04488156_11281 [Bacillus sp. 166amftsu]